MLPSVSERGPSLSLLPCDVHVGAGDTEALSCTRYPRPWVRHTRPALGKSRDTRAGHGQPKRRHRIVRWILFPASLPPELYLHPETLSRCADQLTSITPQQRCPPRARHPPTPSPLPLAIPRTPADHPARHRLHRRRLPAGCPARGRAPRQRRRADVRGLQAAADVGDEGGAEEGEVRDGRAGRAGRLCEGGHGGEQGPA